MKLFIMSEFEAPPNGALQLTLEIGPRLATLSLGPISSAAELCC